MLQAVQLYIFRFFNKGHERSLKAKRNIVMSLLIKGGSVIISFLLIPLTINYVNPAQYGIWLTLSSLITWAALFDMGLGNGLKNKLTEFIALDDMAQARSYVSSAYAMLCVISILLFLVFWPVNVHLHWNHILNTGAAKDYDLNNLVLLIFGFFCIQFVLQLINTVLTANQEPAKTGVINFIAQLLTFIAILILAKYTTGSLNLLVWAFAGIPLLVLLFGSIWFYNHNYKPVAPSFKLIKLSSAKQLLATGSTFFIIQIAALVMYESDNIVITRLFGPKEVTTFNIAYKLFSVILMFFVIVITPFWSAFTEAYTKGDFDWIKSAIANANKMWFALSLCAVFLLLLSPWVYHLWVGKTVTVPLNLSIAMCVYCVAFIWQAIHVQLINGTGKIRLQLYLGIFAMVLNIPLCIFLGRRIGLAGITWSNTIFFIIMGIVFSIQTKKIINKTATGIFNA
jgi:O-antigen/teichoic acid export membrane protein